MAVQTSYMAVQTSYMAVQTPYMAVQTPYMAVQTSYMAVRTFYMAVHTFKWQCKHPAWQCIHSNGSANICKLHAEFVRDTKYVETLIWQLSLRQHLYVDSKHVTPWFRTLYMTSCNCGLVDAKFIVLPKTSILNLAKHAAQNMVSMVIDAHHQHYKHRMFLERPETVVHL